VVTTAEMRTQDALRRAGLARHEERSNAYHGSAYWYYAIGSLGQQLVSQQSQIASGIPNIAAKVLQHTYGASFGAPIIKDNSSFGAYEDSNKPLTPWSPKQYLPPE